MARSRKHKLVIKHRASGEFKGRNRGRSKMRPTFKTAAKRGRKR